MKDIDDEDFEIDPRVNTKAGKSGKRDDMRQGISGFNFKDAIKDANKDIVSMKSEDYNDEDDLNALDSARD